MGVRKNRRYGVLFAAMAVQLCTGIIYMWSVFQNYLVSSGVFSEQKAGEVAFIASVMLAMFVVGIVGGGRLSDKIGAKKVVFAGSVLFAAGLFLSSFLLTSQPWTLYLSYGVIGGIGVGAAYNSSIACAQKWFPEKRGFASGMVVCAFGFSIVIFSPLATQLLNALGASTTFRILAGAFLVICLTASLFIKEPEPGYAPEGYTPPAASSVQQQGFTTGQMLKTPQFYFLTMAMMFLTPAYFILNPLFITLGLVKGLSSELATVVVMLTGIASSAGRLLAPWISDKIGRKGTIVALNIITLACMVLMIFTQGIAYIVLIALIACAYGGSSGVFPPYCSDMYGTKHAGANYGCVMVGFGISAVLFPFLAASVNTSGALKGDYTLSFLIAAAASVISIICTLLIQAKKLKNPTA
ncbi:MAG: OFA family MFS transporter [Christensenellales bacterium]|jgi:OFA family oxalate/formate antiporter-like MFS transporter